MISNHFNTRFVVFFDPRKDGLWVARALQGTPGDEDVVAGAFGDYPAQAFERMMQAYNMMALGGGVNY